MTLDSAPGTYRIQLFRNSACDGSGHGEGQTLVANATLVIVATPTETLVGIPGLAAGQFVSATATDDEGNTSEFSNCASVQPVQWTIASGGNGNFSEYVKVTGLSWAEARDAAAVRTHNGVTGRLVTIANAAENQFVNALANGGPMRAWIGLYDPDGTGPRTFEWITGESDSYRNWGGGEPNNFNSEFWVEIFGDATWNNNVNSFTGTFGYIVEYPAPAIPDSLGTPSAPPVSPLKQQ